MTMRSWTCWLCWGVMSVTLYKLSWRNARRQARDYLVYFVTIVMAAALIYAFNGLVFSREIADLSEKLASLPLMIVLASAAAVLITGWLVSYTTGFMWPGCFFWKTWRWAARLCSWGWRRGICCFRH